MSHIAKSLRQDMAQAQNQDFSHAMNIEQELKAAKRVLAVLINKAGGTIELTPADFHDLSGNTKIEVSIDHQTEKYIYKVKNAS